MWAGQAHFLRDIPRRVRPVLERICGMLRIGADVAHLSERC